MQITFCVHSFRAKDCAILLECSCTGPLMMENAFFAYVCRAASSRKRRALAASEASQEFREAEFEIDEKWAECH